MQAGKNVKEIDITQRAQKIQFSDFPYLWKLNVW